MGKRSLSLEVPLQNEVMEEHRRVLIEYVRRLPACAQERILTTPEKLWAADHYRDLDGSGCLVGIALDLPWDWGGQKSVLSPESVSLLELTRGFENSVWSVEGIFDRFFNYFGRKKTVAFLRAAIESVK